VKSAGLQDDWTRRVQQFFPRRALEGIQTVQWRRALRRSSPAQRSRAFELGEGLLRDRTARGDERRRIVAAKMLVALLPDSMPSIRALLRAFDDADAYEVHFSVLCFLTEAEEFLRDREIADVLEVFREYLMSASSNRALSAWMAGHALGGHFEAKHTAPILLEAARTARFAAGRGAAVKGLGEHLDEAPPDLHEAIVRELRSRARTDRSESVKAAARNALNLAGIRRSTPRRR
jgi:hypothetical protein